MESFRFKVVKIISKEPFKRGRWLCMDFTDPPSNGTTNIEDCLAHNRPDIVSSTGQGVSAVAIDNKIEQAMDLVKSHLMFAVREEMDVLKERICELTEKNSRLERENKIFRANATPETIQLVDQFNQQAQLQPRQSSPSQAQLTASLPPFTSNPVSNPVSNAVSNTAQPTANTSPQTTVQQSTSAITTISTLPNQTINQQLSQQISTQIVQQQQISSQISQQQQQQQLNSAANSQPAASNQATANQLT